MSRPTQLRQISPLRGPESLEAREQPAALLADLNTLGNSGVSTFVQPPPAVTKAGAFFQGTDGVNAGLWKTDGTATGAVFLGVTPSSSPYVNPTAVGEKVFFFNEDAKTGNELWTSDGTKAGTKMVKDIVPGVGGVYPTGAVGVNGKFVFVRGVYAPGEKPQMYSSDGTAAGTQLLATLPGYEGSPFVAAGNVAFYTSNVSDMMTGLPSGTIYRTNGTKTGTTVFATLPAGTAVTGVGVDAGPWGGMVGNKFVFMATNQTTGRELWVSDGTKTGTKLLKDINTRQGVNGGFGSDPHDFRVDGNVLYFTADDGVKGQELWRTDGTAAGTKMVVDLSPNVASDPAVEPPYYMFSSVPNGSKISQTTVIGGKLWFSANNGTAGDQLYISDGTAAGTKPLTAVTHTPASVSPFRNEFPDIIGPLGNKTLFSIGSATSGRQLWVSDGTKAGTMLLKSIGMLGGKVSSWDMGPIPLGVVGGKLIFSANDGVIGRQLWTTDGTTAGTKLLQRLNLGTEGSAPRSFIAAGTKSFFLANDTYRSTTVYATDGKTAPVAVKRYLRPDWAFPTTANEREEGPAQLAYLNGKTYFVSQQGPFGRQLWTSDGTLAGTKLLKTFALPKDYSLTNFNNPLGIDHLTVFQGAVYFTSDVPGTGQQLWKTDGTAAGTKLVKLLSPNSSTGWSFGETMGPVRQLTVMGNKLFFAANNGVNGEELWVSDGTAAGTKMLKDINVPAVPGPFAQNHSSGPNDLTVMNGKLYFTAWADETKNRQLMVSDGTVTGTKVVANIYADMVTGPFGTFRLPGEPETRGMVTANGKLFFTGQDVTNGYQLWTSDGTAAGTKRLTGLVKLPKDTFVENLRAVGKKVYFTAYTPTAGKQLWVSDGTDAGTKMTKQIGNATNVPPSTSPYLASGANPSIVAIAGEKVYFVANDPAKGRELFVTDGTTAGTKLVKDFLPGSGSGAGNPADGNNSAAIIGNLLILGVNDPARGLEPWAVPLTELA